MKKFRFQNLRFLLAIGMVMQLFNSCNKELNTSNPNDCIAVTGVNLDKAILVLFVGEEQYLTATAVPYNATNKTVIWTSSDSTIVLVTNGKVKAVAIGTAAVTATTQDGLKTDLCTVIVHFVSINGITLSKTSATLTVGGSEQLTASISPDDATNKTIYWSSDNTNVATVSSSGIITAAAIGSATITVTTEDCKYSSACTVEVLDGIVINGVCWAPRNVDNPGTFAARIEDAGMFYQWNRKVGWSAIDPLINSYGDTAWDKSMSVVTFLAKLNWDKSQDPSPSGWHVPDEEDIKKLLNTDKVNNEWTTRNGVYGRDFTDKTSGNSIFLPAVGIRNGDNGVLLGNGSFGHYWNNTPCNLYSNPFIKSNLFLFIGGAGWDLSHFNDGLIIRPVAN